VNLSNFRPFKFDPREHNPQQLCSLFICFVLNSIANRQSLAQREKLLCAGNGIGHCVLPVDDNWCGELVVQTGETRFVVDCRAYPAKLVGQVKGFLAKNKQPGVASIVLDGDIN